MAGRNARGLLVLSVAAALAACASNAPVQQAPVSASTTTPAAGATVPVTAEATKMVGYRRKVQNGEEYFCKNEGVTGSRVKVVEVCLTVAQMQAIQDKSQQDLRDLQGPGWEMPEINAGAAGY